MRLIDRYIFGLFVKVFVLCFVCLTGIYIVGDFVGNLNEFIDAAGENGGLVTLFVTYYGARVPWFFDLIGRVAALIAAVFVVTWLQRHREMTALMAAGISRWRILRPLVIAVALISITAAINRETLLPKVREKLSQQVRDLSSGNARPLNARYDHQTDFLIDGQDVIAAEKRIIQPIIRLPLQLQNYAYQLSAPTALRLPAAREHPAGYLLRAVTVPENIDRMDDLMIEQRPVILTSKNHSWLQPGECFVVSNISLWQMTQDKTWRQYAATGDLIAGLSNPSLDIGADVRVAVHARIVQPVLDLALFFLGVPVVLTKESRNVFVSAGSCLLIVAVYFLVVLACHNLGQNYLIPPARAAWLPVMVLVPWAVASSLPLRR